MSEPVSADGRRIGGHRANGLRCVAPLYTLPCRTMTARGRKATAPGRCDRIDRPDRHALSGALRQPAGGSGSWPKGGIGVKIHSGVDVSVVRGRLSVHPSEVFR